MSACLIFNVADVKLGVLFISHHMFFLSFSLYTVNCGVHSYSACKLPFCVHNCNLIFFMDSQGGGEKVYSVNSFRDNDTTV